MRSTPTARLRSPRLRARAGISSAILLAFAAGASCPTKTDDCAHEATQRCLWERGQAKQTEAGASGPSADTSPDTDTNVASQQEATELDQALSDIIEIMAAGLEWALINERARSLCEKLGPRDAESVATPEPDAADSETWSCPVFALDINGQPLVLEASAGVISLSAEPLDSSQSEALLDFARARFDEWCSGEFEEIEGGKLDVYHRCALPEGPYLVIARFPRNLELDQWQVSIAVVDAG